MDLFTIIQLIILAIAALVVGFSSHSKLNDFLKLVSLISIGILLANQSEGDVQAIYSILGVTAFNFLLSRFDRFRGKYFSLIPILFSCVLFIAISYGNVLSLDGDSFSILNKFSIAGIIMATFSFQFMDLKGAALMKLFKVEKDLYNRSINLFFLGFSIYLTSFGAGVFGLFLTAGFYLVANFYRQEENGTNYPIAFGILLIALSLPMDSISGVNLVDGDVLFGALVGVFSILFLSKSNVSDGKKTVLSIVGVLLILGVAVLLIYAGSMHPGMGGYDAIIGMIFGAAVASVFVTIEIVSLGIILGLFIVGSTIPSLFVNDDLLEFEEKSIGLTTNENIQNHEIPNQQFLSLNGVVGKYKLIEDSSNVTFTLGKKNETKGAFKKISGSVEFKEEIGTSSFEINLAMIDFTTFNKFRDESLVSDEYFNVSKFPTMKFKANQLHQIDSLHYELTGFFEMLGKKLEEKVTLQRVENDKGIVLIGKGKIDRTKYGMTPSATEGNIVTFEYQAHIRQK